MAGLLLVLSAVNIVQDGEWSWRDASGPAIAITVASQAISLRLDPGATRARMALALLGLAAALTTIVLAFL